MLYLRLKQRKVLKIVKGGFLGFGDIKEFSKKKRKMRILKRSHSAKKLRSEDFSLLQATYQNLEGGPFGDKKLEKKVAQWRKN